VEAPHELSSDRDDAQLFFCTIPEQDVDFGLIFDPEHIHPKKEGIKALEGFFSKGGCVFGYP
jgi:hypothetical protein